MRLINVRKGQFVYYKNRLHKVYSVKPFFKLSVHLVRLADLHQEIVTAREIDLYRPQHLDSFLYNGKRFTLDKNTRAAVGDYILVIAPNPDSLDRHHLHAIEIVTAVEDSGVISNKMNGIKHEEYWVMKEGKLDGGKEIDRQNPAENGDDSIHTVVLPETHASPRVGDVYQKNDSDPLLQAMVVAIDGSDVYLGNGMKVSITELTSSDRWSLVIQELEH